MNKVLKKLTCAAEYECKEGAKRQAMQGVNENAQRK